jgi:hypothetical protein
VPGRGASCPSGDEVQDSKAPAGGRRSCQPAGSPARRAVGVSAHHSPAEGTNHMGDESLSPVRFAADLAVPRRCDRPRAVPPTANLRIGTNGLRRASPFGGLRGPRPSLSATPGLATPPSVEVTIGPIPAARALGGGRVDRGVRHHGMIVPEGHGSSPRPTARQGSSCRPFSTLTAPPSRCSPTWVVTAGNRRSSSAVQRQPTRRG